MSEGQYNENWQEVESVTGSQMTSYIWGVRYVDDLVLREKGEERLYSLADPNWNVVALVDASGAVVERMKYDAFGKVSWLDAAFGTKASSDYDWNRTFTGQVLDSETGLMLYRNRFYHTELGRFVSRDPIGYRAGDVNVYRYCNNSVQVILDPLGLQWFQKTYSISNTVITGYGFGGGGGHSYTFTNNYLLKFEMPFECNNVGSPTNITIKSQFPFSGVSFLGFISFSTSVTTDVSAEYVMKKCPCPDDDNLIITALITVKLGNKNTVVGSIPFLPVSPTVDMPLNSTYFLTDTIGPLTLNCCSK